MSWVVVITLAFSHWNSTGLFGHNAESNSNSEVPKSFPVHDSVEGYFETQRIGLETPQISSTRQGSRLTNRAEPPTTVTPSPTTVTPSPTTVTPGPVTITTHRSENLVFDNSVRWKFSEIWKLLQEDTKTTTTPNFYPTRFTNRVLDFSQINALLPYEDDSALTINSATVTSTSVETSPILTEKHYQEETSTLLETYSTTEKNYQNESSTLPAALSTTAVDYQDESGPPAEASSTAETHYQDESSSTSESAPTSLTHYQNESGLLQQPGDVSFTHYLNETNLVSANGKASSRHYLTESAFGADDLAIFADALNIENLIDLDAFLNNSKTSPSTEKPEIPSFLSPTKAFNSLLSFIAHLESLNPRLDTESRPNGLQSLIVTWNRSDPLNEKLEDIFLPKLDINEPNSDLTNPTSTTAEISKTSSGFLGKSKTENSTFKSQIFGENYTEFSRDYDSEILTENFQPNSSFIFNMTVIVSKIAGYATENGTRTNITNETDSHLTSLNTSVTLPLVALLDQPFEDFDEIDNCPCKPGYKCMSNLNTCVLDVHCPNASRYGKGPPSECPTPSDPNNRAPSPLESWFTEEIFNDLFPKANIGWGSQKCWPYSYESFKIAIRYFPRFASEFFDNGYSRAENFRRDLAAFFSHAIQETGENNGGLYDAMDSKQAADACFYRGGFYNWFEGGPTSNFLPKKSPGYQPSHGDSCVKAGRYCNQSPQAEYFYPCSLKKNGTYYEGCYFGRGAIQISYNFNYGPFQQWLKRQNIEADLLNDPNLLMTKLDPPLAIMASLWFYMTPQPPKPSMHDIILGQWEAGETNKEAGYFGPIFGPTSLIINNECNGEDSDILGGPGESRRIKAFKWFCDYFGVPTGPERTLSCKDMPAKLDQIQHKLSYQPDWQTTWKDQPCECAPASYGGPIPYYEEDFYPAEFVALNAANKDLCETVLYERPDIFTLKATEACLKHPRKSTVSGSSTETTAHSTETAIQANEVITSEMGYSEKPEAKIPIEDTLLNDALVDVQLKAEETANATSDCAKGDGFFAVPNDCQRFYRCVHGKKYPQKCPNGLAWNSNVSVCDHKENVGC